ncbi:MAG: M23 family metallopeptidase [Deltaproteobacteria bacterium]|nr:M23 family metallopeptidase [Deltaproteobacteria bacterium]
MHKRFILFLISAILAFLCAHFIFGGLQTFIDWYPPQITMQRTAKYIGLNGFEFQALVQDLSGVRKARYQLFQNKRKVLDKTIVSKKSELLISIPVDPTKLELRQGAYNLVITAFDGSIRTNKSSTSISFNIDFTKPRIVSVTNMQNVRVGGFEMFVFELLNDASIAECVAVDNRNFFLALPISKFGINSKKNVKASLFALPLEHPKTLKLVSYARNYDLYSFKFPHLILPFRGKTSLVPENVFNNLLTISRSLKSGAKFYQLQDCEPIDVSRCFIEGAFIKPVENASYYAVFGQILKTSSNKSTRLTEDIFWLTHPSSSIRAPSKGIVESFENGILTLNYGCGIRSSFYPLQYTLVPVGEKFNKGQVIAEVFRTSAEFVGHQITLWGHPVNIREFEDERWIFDHIIKKLNFVSDVVALKK